MGAPYKYSDAISDFSRIYLATEHRRRGVGPRSINGGSAVKKERRILIVDDDRESIHLTQEDGGDVAAQIEADPGMQRTPIIFLIALVTKAEAKAGVQIEGHPVVAKPVSIPS
jgi:CheY-like chemotaxis protein